MLQTSQENKLCLNLEKCTFLIPFGNLLGHVISKERLLTDPAKVATILHYPQSKANQRILGFNRVLSQVCKRICTNMDPYSIY